MYVFLVGFITSACAQTGFRPEDVASIESIISAVHESMSGKPGEVRDWDRFRSLFKPEARFITSPVLPDGGGFGYNPRTLDDTIEGMSAWLMENGLDEKPVHNVIEQFGRLAHVFTTYESRQDAADPTPTYGRGIASFQLLHDGTRWWVVNWFWTGERPETPIPPRYLPEG